MRQEKLRTYRIFPALALCATLLTCLSVLGHLISQTQPQLSWLYPGQLQRLLDINGEGNLVAWYTSGLWLTFALTALTLGLLTRQVRLFLPLVLIGFFASADETAMFHEIVKDLGHQLPASWAVTSPTWLWVYLGAPLAFLLAFLSLPTLQALPPLIRYRLYLAGVLFLSSSLVLDTLSGLVSQAETREEIPLYLALTHAEEFGEMLAIALALSGLVSLLIWNRDEGQLRAHALLRQPSSGQKEAQA